MDEEQEMRHLTLREEVRTRLAEGLDIPVELMVSDQPPIEHDLIEED